MLVFGEKRPIRHKMTSDSSVLGQDKTLLLNYNEHVADNCHMIKVALRELQK